MPFLPPNQQRQSTEAVQLQHEHKLDEQNLSLSDFMSMIASAFSSLCCSFAIVSFDDANS